LETRYKGYCSGPLVEAVLELTPTLLEEMPGASWLLDLVEVTGFDSAAREAGSKILKTFKARGGRKFAAIIPGAMLRMLISSVAFAAGLPVKVFETRTEGLKCLRSAS
jgi:hypothetical protein